MFSLSSIGSKVIKFLHLARNTGLLWGNAGANTPVHISLAGVAHQLV